MSDRSDPLVRMSQEGYAAIRSGQLSRAEELFSHLLGEDPGNSYAIVGLADVARKRRNYRTAVERYQQCLELYPDNSFALFGLAESYRALRRFRKAVEVWERYIRFDPDNVNVLTRIADAYRKTGEFDRSRDVYQRVLELEPENNYALIGMGYLHYDFRDYHSARTYWQRMRDKTEPNVDIRVLTALGNCERKMKRFQTGLEIFNRAAAVEPDNFYVCYGLADCYRGMGQTERALAMWQHILRRDPGNRVILARSGDACRILGRLAEAEAWYIRALDVGPDTYATLGLVEVLRARGASEEATHHVEQLVEIEPDNPRVFSLLAECYRDQGRFAEALALLERHARSRGNQSEAIARLIADLRRHV